MSCFGALAASPLHCSLYSLSVTDNDWLAVNVRVTSLLRLCGWVTATQLQQQRRFRFRHEATHSQALKSVIFVSVAVRRLTKVLLLHKPTERIIRLQLQGRRLRLESTFMEMDVGMCIRSCQPCCPLLPRVFPCLVFVRSVAASFFQPLLRSFIRSRVVRNTTNEQAGSLAT